MNATNRVRAQFPSATHRLLLYLYRRASPHFSSPLFRHLLPLPPQRMAPHGHPWPTSFSPRRRERNGTTKARSTRSRNGTRGQARMAGDRLCLFLSSPRRARRVVVVQFPVPARWDYEPRITRMTRMGPEPERTTKHAKGAKPEDSCRFQRLTCGTAALGCVALPARTMPQPRAAVPHPNASARDLLTGNGTREPGTPHVTPSPADLPLPRVPRLS